MCIYVYIHIHPYDTNRCQAQKKCCLKGRCNSNIVKPLSTHLRIYLASLRHPLNAELHALVRAHDTRVPECKAVKTQSCGSCGVLQVWTLGSRYTSGFLQGVLPIWARGSSCKPKLLRMAARPDSFGIRIRGECRKLAFLHSWGLL